MRLLQLEENGAFSLSEHIEKDDIPSYAILSHTWGADQEGVSFKDLMEGTGKDKIGYRKLTFCGKQAAKDGLQFFWVDTCCIDKSSSQELSEAINSMFRWYQDAARCYAYLTDVSIGSSLRNKSPLQQAWKSAFKQSRWFTRGWTLQELIAPRFVQFFSMEGERFGDKSQLAREIYEVTGVSTQALQGTPLSQFGVDERMSWAEGRKTKREEDAAYSLLGLFGIHMSLLYGEGRTNAFNRLRKEIAESARDEASAMPLAASTSQSKRKQNDDNEIERRLHGVVCFRCMYLQPLEKYCDLELIDDQKVENAATMLMSIVRNVVNTGMTTQTFIVINVANMVIMPMSLIVISVANMVIMPMSLIALYAIAETI